MTPLIEKTWDLICTGAKLIAREDDSIKITNSDKIRYRENFENLHHKVLEYMKDSSKPLDRHKIAAILIISTIRTDVLKSTKKNENDIFIGNYILATEVGLSYMLQILNEELEKRELPPIEKYYFPEAFSCKTDYSKIFYRNLYFSNENADWGLNPLDIAERLFLLEYITLLKNEIDTSILKEV